MKRTMITIGAVLYLAACWAPQLWTGRADAQEKPKEPAVLEEVRARRFVLVDAEGRELGNLFVDDEGGPVLALTSVASRRLAMYRADAAMFGAASVTSGETTAFVHVSPDGIMLESDGQTRAKIGKVETVNKRTGAETTQEGAFVSYDADGNVLWMEPK